MNTRSKKRKDVHSNSDSVRMQQSQSKTRKTTQSDTDDAETLYENFSSPTFNIHIHVPYYDSNNSKLFLPRIQPIINLHFDEIARRIESIDKKNEKSLYEIFQNILTKISPKFGVVKFHFENHSKDFQESDKNNVTPCSSRTSSNVTELNTGINFEKTQNIVTRSSKRVLTADIGSEISRSNSKNDENHASIIYELDKDVKLKNAVVVLTDICKTKHYKNYIRTYDSVKSPDDESEDSCNFTRRMENTHGSKQKNEKIISEIEKHDTCCRSDSFVSKCNNSNLDMPEKYLTGSCSNKITEKGIYNKSDIEKIEKSQNLISLVEGWNFSDILNRFQIKQSEYCYNSTTPSNDIIENENCDIEKNSNGLDFQLNKKNEYLKEDTKFSDIELNIEVGKDEIELNEEDNSGRYVSNEKNLSLLQYQNETADGFFTDKFICETKEDIKQEFASNPSEVFDLSPGDCKSTSGEKASLEVITDWETVKSDLPSIMPNAVENKFEIPEKNKSSISNVKLPEVYFELIKKEMKRRGMHFPAGGKVQQNLKSEKSNVEITMSETSSFSKKQKRSSEQVKKSKGKKTKPSAAEDFIPLNSSGPTKFVVASLNAVKYSDEREAKNFKRDMLFGKRVNRFSRSDELRIYQLKKEAIQKSLNN